MALWATAGSARTAKLATAMQIKHTRVSITSIVSVKALPRGVYLQAETEGVSADKL